MDIHQKVTLAVIRARHALKSRANGGKDWGICRYAFKADGIIDPVNANGIIIEDERDIVRIRHSLRKRRMDAKNGKTYPTEPDSWITLKSNGEHVPLDKNGVAIGGAGGWATGKDFSKAKRTSKKAPSGGGKPETSSPPKTKAELKKNAATHVQKCDELRTKLEKEMKSNSDYITKAKYAQMDVESAKRHKAMAEKILKDLKQKADKLDTGKSTEELKKICDQFLDEGEKEQNWVNKHPDPEHESERTKRRQRIRELRDKYIDARKELDAKISAKMYEVELSNSTKTLEEAEKKLKKIEEEGPSPEYRALCGEYEKAAKERNRAILKAYDSVEDCESSKEVNDYLNAKGYFRQDGDDALRSEERVDITKMTPENARAYAGRVQSLMEDYPWLAGQLDGIDCHDFSSERKKGTYGYARGTHLSFAEGFYGDASKVPEKYRDDAKKSYEDDVKSKHHPEGTDYTSVMDHEVAHAMEKIIQKKAEEKGIPLHDGRVANEVMKRVQKKLYGKYTKTKEKEVRAAVSRYSAVNRGISKANRENKQYGRNTEFLAEAMAEARGSSTPRDIAKAAREAFEELMKEVGLR